MTALFVEKMKDRSKEVITKVLEGASFSEADSALGFAKNGARQLFLANVCRINPELYAVGCKPGTHIADLEYLRNHKEEFMPTDANIAKAREERVAKEQSKAAVELASALKFPGIVEAMCAISIVLETLPIIDMKDPWVMWKCAGSGCVSLFLNNNILEIFECELDVKTKLALEGVAVRHNFKVTNDIEEPSKK